MYPITPFMKKFTLLTLFSALLLLGAGCQAQNQVTSLVPAVEELQTQTVPEVIKQEKSNVPATAARGTVGKALYRGFYFDIEYPENFTPSPTTPTTVSNGQTNVQTDEAYFTSPDETVEFFVYSPLWSGNPISYLEVSNSEEVVDRRSETRENVPTDLGADSSQTIEWVTIKAKNNSYHRSYMSITNSGQGGSKTHHVFGIKYQDNASYEQHKEAYVAFKESLQQYAD